MSFVPFSLSERRRANAAQMKKSITLWIGDFLSLNFPVVFFSILARGTCCSSQIEERAEVVRERNQKFGD